MNFEPCRFINTYGKTLGNAQMKTVLRFKMI